MSHPSRTIFGEATGLKRRIGSTRIKCFWLEWKVASVEVV